MFGRLILTLFFVSAASEANQIEMKRTFINNKDWNVAKKYPGARIPAVASVLCLKSEEACEALNKKNDGFEQGTINNCTVVGTEGTDEVYYKRDTFKQVEVSGFVYTGGDSQQENTDLSYTLSQPGNDNCTRVRGPPRTTLTGSECYTTNYKKGILRYCKEDGRPETWAPGDADWVQGPPTANAYIFYEMTTIGKDQCVVVLVGRHTPLLSKVEILGRGGDSSSWFQAEDHPIPIYGFSLVALSSMEVMTVAGATDTSTWVDSVYIYSLAHDTWTQKADLPKTAYGSSCAEATRGGRRQVLCLRGNSHEILNNEIFAYDIITDVWTNLNAPNPYIGTGQYSPNTLFFDNKVIFFGGTDLGFAPSRKVTAFDLDSEEWTEMEDSLNDAGPGIKAYMFLKHKMLVAV